MAVQNEPENDLTINMLRIFLSMTPLPYGLWYRTKMSAKKPLVMIGLKMSFYSLKARIT
jgi:hypothetical protein